MWKVGSMGYNRGWHYGQAQEMFREMHEHAEREYGGPSEMGGNMLAGLLGGFIGSFAEKAGADIADKVTGGSEEHVIVEHKD